MVSVAVYRDDRLLGRSLTEEEANKGVEQLFMLLQLDNRNKNRKDWNPLGEFISEGDNVVIKPNFVMHRNLSDERHNDCVTTDPSVLKAVLGYAHRACGDGGRISVCDVPLQSCDIERLLKEKRLDFGGFSFRVEFIDCRQEVAVLDGNDVIVERRKIRGDPRGYTVVDLGRESNLYEISRDYRCYRVTDYDRDAMCEHHNMEKNEYIIPNTVLEADCILNVPKLKTHKKAGITCCLKNMIGIVGDKSWLPHHRAGGKLDGGDEYPEGGMGKSFESKAIGLMRQRLPFLWKPARMLHSMLRRGGADIREGSWYGNDTLWRTILDINLIMLYFRDGKMNDKIARKHFAVVDAVVCAEGEGPLHGISKRAGMLIAGADPVATDTIAATIMGFDAGRIPQLSESRSLKKHPLGTADITGISYESNMDIMPNLKFMPPQGWREHIELP
ncbi:MAG: DUF362 domain-containing protein [Candidatus Altiarchaeota archaeon]